MLNRSKVFLLVIVALFIGSIIFVTALARVHFSNHCIVSRHPRCHEKTTESALNTSPLWNVTPFRSLNV